MNSLFYFYTLFVLEDFANTRVSVPYKDTKNLYTYYFESLGPSEKCKVRLYISPLDRSTSMFLLYK